MIGGKGHSRTPGIRPRHVKVHFVVGCRNNEQIATVSLDEGREKSRAYVDDRRKLGLHGCKAYSVCNGSGYDAFDAVSTSVWAP